MNTSQSQSNREQSFSPQREQEQIEDDIAVAQRL